MSAEVQAHQSCDSGTRSPTPRRSSNGENWRMMHRIAQAAEACAPRAAIDKYGSTQATKGGGDLRSDWRMCRHASVQPATGHTAQEESAVAQVQHQDEHLAAGTGG